MPGDLDALRSKLAEGRVTVDPEIMRRFEEPERGEPGSARFVIEPGSVDELSETVAWAYESSARLVIQGANTGLVGASTPDASGSQGVLQTGRLNAILELSPTDRTVVVEAGVRLSALNDLLAPEGLFFPIELGSDPSIGGLIATNAGGARTIRYGTAGSRVMSLQAVVGDSKGSLIGSISRLRKDSSRLNPSRLLIGSYGALGVVARAALRVAVKPLTSAAAFFAVASGQAAMECLAAFESRFGEDLSAFELISGDAMRLAASTLPHLRTPLGTEHGEYLLVEVVSHDDSSPEIGLASLLDQLSAPNGPVKDGVIAPPADLWAVRHSLSEGIRSGGATLRFDLAVPRESLPSLRPLLEAELRRDTPPPLITEFGHWAEGGTHLQLVYSNRVLPASSESIRRRVYAVVVNQLMGTFSAEHGLGPHNAPFYREFVPPQEREFERRVKELYDPKGIFGSSPLA